MRRAVSGSRYVLFIAVCSAVGALVSGLALQHHYGHDATSFCNINATFDCDIVNRSSYSKVAGIPVALAGLVAYVLIGCLAMFQRGEPETPALILLLGSSGLAFSVYLTYVEAQVLRSFCLLCLTSLVAITLITVLSALRLRSESGTESGQ